MFYEDSKEDRCSHSAVLSVVLLEKDGKELLTVGTKKIGEEGHRNELAESGVSVGNRSFCI